MTWLRKVEVEPRNLQIPQGRRAGSLLLLLSQALLVLMFILIDRHVLRGVVALCCVCSYLLFSVWVLVRTLRTAKGEVELDEEALVERIGGIKRELPWRDIRLVRRIGPNLTWDPAYGFAVNGADGVSIQVNTERFRRDELVRLVVRRCYNASGVPPDVVGPSSQPQADRWHAAPFMLTSTAVSIAMIVYFMGRLVHRW